MHPTYLVRLTTARRVSLVLTLIAFVFSATLVGIHTAFAAPTFSVVDVVPNSGTVTTGDEVEVFFQEATNNTELTLGSCEVNGVSVGSLQNLTDGLYKVIYTVGTTDTNRAAGTLPINCTLQGSDGNTTVTTFTAANTLAVEVGEDGAVPVITSVSSVPNDGNAAAGDTIDIYFQAENANDPLVLEGPCLINGINTASSFEDHTGGQYRVEYAVANGHTERAAGTIPIQCTFKSTDSGLTVTVDRFTETNTLALDIDNNGTIGGGDTGTDTIPPVITLNGASTVHVTVGNAFVDPGTTATDNVDTFVNVVVGGDTVTSTTAVGSYTVTYNATDAAGNHATQVTRTVIVDAEDNDDDDNNTATTTTGTINGNVTGGSATSTGMLAVTGVQQVRTTATANGAYEDGWEWVFDVTVPSNETYVQMKLTDWAIGGGDSTISVGNNVRISSNQADSTSALTLSASDVYSLPALHIVGDLDTSLPGKQVKITVEARVPAESANGNYSTSYGIRASNNN